MCCKTEATTSYWMRSTPTAWPPTSGPTTPSSPAWQQMPMGTCFALLGSWGGSCSPKGMCRSAPSLLHPLFTCLRKSLLLAKLPIAWLVCQYRTGLLGLVAYQPPQMLQLVCHCRTAVFRAGNLPTCSDALHLHSLSAVADHKICCNFNEYTTNCNAIAYDCCCRC